MENDIKKSTVYVPKERQKEALLIAKKKGINKFSTLVNVLLAEYVEKNYLLIKK